MRCEYTFEYVHAHKSMMKIIVPNVEKNQAPKQGHIALTDKNDEMSVMYISSIALPPPQVQYGTTKDHLMLTKEGNSTTYGASDM